MIEVIQIARLLVAVVCLGAAVVGLTHWAVKAKKLSPFGGFARAIRKVSDPIIKPLERRIVRSGGNPVNAPWWLFWIVVIGGLVFPELCCSGLWGPWSRWGMPPRPGHAESCASWWMGYSDC